MKKLLKFIFLSVFIFTAAIQSSSAMVLQYDNQTIEYTGSIFSLMINGNNITDLPMPPIIFNDRALVPLREVFEAMDADVNYDSAKKEISVDYGGNTLKLTIGSSQAFLNNSELIIPDGVTPKLIAKAGESAKTMVPVRFISESVGMKVDFDENNGVIMITSPKASPDASPNITPDSSPDTSPGTSPDTQPAAAESNGPKKISALDTIETYIDGEDTVLEISSSDGFGEFTTEKQTQPTRIIVHADGVAARSAMLSCEINKGYIKLLRIAYADKGSTIVLDTEQNIGEYEVSVNDKIMSIRIKPYIPPEPTTAPETTADPEQSGSPAVFQTGEKIIVIDPGHGGSDPGTSGSLNGVVYEEKNINLTVSRKVVDILRSSGYNVQMTREGDTYPTLEERSAFANSLNAALFVSIHSNSYEQSSANGTEVYYSENNNGAAYGITSEQAAAYVLNSFLAQAEMRNRGVKSANHVVTRTSNMPAILVELGFLTNESDISKLTDENFQNAVAQGIADGIIKCVNLINIPQR